MSVETTTAPAQTTPESQKAVVAAVENHHRVFVGNLPEDFTSDEVIAFFAQHGTITSLQYDSAKRYAFVGFESPEDVEKAITLNGSATLRGSLLKIEAPKPPRHLRSRRNFNSGDDSPAPGRPSNQQRRPRAPRAPRGPRAAAPAPAAASTAAADADAEATSDEASEERKVLDRITNKNGTDVTFFKTPHGNNARSTPRDYSDETVARTVYVGNLHTRINKFILARIFLHVLEQLAPEETIVLKNSYVVLDHELVSRTFGYLEFETAEQADRAVALATEYIAAHVAEAAQPTKKHVLDPATTRSNPAKYLCQNHLLRILGRVPRVSKATSAKKRSSAAPAAEE